jgi:hypothetical protein
MTRFGGRYATPTTLVTTDSVGSVAAAHLQRHGRAYHEGHVCGLLCLQTAYARQLFRAFLTYPTESRPSLPLWGIKPAHLVFRHNSHTISIISNIG